MVRPKRIIMIDYLPARLVRAKDRWYFSYYQRDPATGKRRRHRESFDIGRIPIESRLEAAKEIIQSINAKLPFGYPYDEDFYIRQVSMDIHQAFKLVEEVSQELRQATKLSYASSMRRFVSFLQSLNLDREPINCITRKVAIAYSDYLIRSGRSGVTHNGNITDLKRAFNILISRELITVNPFVSIRKMREEEKSRRALTSHEVQIILTMLLKNDVSVYLGCLLQYFCFIRPNEQRFLQKKDFNLADQQVLVKGSISKNNKSAYVTIPNQLVGILKQLGFDALSADDHVLGSACRLGHLTPVGKNTLGERYRKIIRNMKSEGILDTIEGNTYYSWKDTGGTELANKEGINGIWLRDQFRHHSLDETQVYLMKSKKANPFIKEHHRLQDDFQQAVK